jgi:hypothetical protein
MNNPLQDKRYRNAYAVRIFAESEVYDMVSSHLLSLTKQRKRNFFYLRHVEVPNISCRVPSDEPIHVEHWKIRR